MAAKKKSTVGKVVEAIKEAAATVATAAEDHVIHPVGRALGLESKPTEAKEKPAEAKPAETKPEAKPAEKKKPAEPKKAKAEPAATATAPAAKKKTVAARVMSQGVAGAVRQANLKADAAESRSPKRKAKGGR